MSLSEQDIQRIAKLAYLHLSAEQLTAIKIDLSRVLKMMENLNRIDTEGVMPMAHAHDVGLCTRADCVTEPNRWDDFQKLAPQAEEGLYLVPKVIE